MCASAAAMAVVLAGASPIGAGPPPGDRATVAGTLVDRAVVRFDAAETGGPSHPVFIFERELAFEARLESLADAGPGDRASPYLDRHVRSALERHIAEELLSHLTVEPTPTERELASRIAAAREVLEQRVGGRGALEAAAAAEGIEPLEVERVVRREARASLYLDRMVAPMLEPSDAELREVHRGANPYRGRPFEEIRGALWRWYVAERLEAALESFFQNARNRVRLTFIS